MSDCKAYIASEMLIAARERAGLSAIELADRLGVGDEVMLWESGGELTVDEAYAFARACGVSLAWMYLPAPPPPKPPLDLREAMAIVLEYAHEEHWRELARQNVDERDSEAFAMVEAHLEMPTTPPTLQGYLCADFEEEE